MSAERKVILSVRSRPLIGNLGGKIEDAVVRAVIQDDLTALIDTRQVVE